MCRLPNQEQIPGAEAATCLITTQAITMAAAARVTTTVTATPAIIPIATAIWAGATVTAIIRRQESRHRQEAIRLQQAAAAVLSLPAAVLPAHQQGRQDKSGQTRLLLQHLQTFIALYSYTGGMDQELKT